MKFGQWGEEKAACYLNENGYNIIEKNFRCRMGEIDIVAEKNGVICFIEVKTRNNEKYGSPAEAVTECKKRHLARTAQYYMMLRKFEERDARIDIIEIIMRGKDPVISHIENAVE